MHRKGAKVKIIVLDAAQRNPFERRFRPSAEGLAAPDAPEGTLALYSVAPGKVIADSTSANSPFVSELIKELRSPNRTAEEVLTWRASACPARPTMSRFRGWLPP